MAKKKTTKKKTTKKKTKASKPKSSPRLDPDRNGTQPKKLRRSNSTQNQIAKRNAEPSEIDPKKVTLSQVALAALQTNNVGPFRDMAPMQRAFLTAYSMCGVIAKAADAAHCATRMHTYWLTHDPEYAEHFDRAIKMSAKGELQTTMMSTAIEGKRKYKFHNGEPVMWINPDTGDLEHYYETEHNTKLQELMLRANDPDKYTEKKEIKQETVADININAASPEQLEVLSKLIDQNDLTASPEAIDVEFYPKDSDSNDDHKTHRD
jgi:hypothetical protein